MYMKPAAIIQRSSTARMVNILDNDESVRKSLVMLMKHHRYESKAWSSSATFLQSADALHAGCLILDYCPYIDAIEVLKILRATESQQKVVVLSARSKVDCPEKEALDLGAIAWLEKPSGAEELISYVKRAFP